MDRLGRGYISLVVYREVGSCIYGLGRVLIDWVVDGYVGSWIDR